MEQHNPSLRPQIAEALTSQEPMVAPRARRCAVKLGLVVLGVSGAMLGLGGTELSAQNKLEPIVSRVAFAGGDEHKLVRPVASVLAEGGAEESIDIAQMFTPSERIKRTSGRRQEEGTVFTSDVRPGWVLPNGNRMVALHIALEPGWKTYWRAPGENGIPPSFDWSGSENLAGVRYHWPRPQVLGEGGAKTIGYATELVLPIELIPEQKGQPIHIRGAVEMGVCRDVCVPAGFSYDVMLPQTGKVDAEIERALRQRPSSGREAGLRSLSCQMTPTKRGMQITAEMDLPSTGGRETVVMEPGQPGLWVSEAQVEREGRRLRAAVEVEAPRGQTLSLERDRLQWTVMGENRVVELRGCSAS